MATQTRERVSKRHDGGKANQEYNQSLYDNAVLGFKNYWYPIFSSKSVGKKPVSITIMKEPIVLMRNSNGEAKALSDECAHRGTLLSVGEGCMIKGSDTITCPYHGWTYSLNDGLCVAVLPEGPDSEVPGKIKIRSYPIEERKGIIWIWMGKGAPVPVEDDIPNLILREDAIAKFYPKAQYGNWRWHAENVQGGHAQMIHKDSVKAWFARAFPMRTPMKPGVSWDLDGFGVDNGRQRKQEPGAKLPSMQTDYPGLGSWNPQRKWRRILLWPWLRKPRPGPLNHTVQGINTVLMFMPGIFRVPNHPSADCMYYEWYVPLDEEHYLYSQITCIFGTNWFQRAWRQLWYYLYGKPTGVIQFNNQDLAYTRQTTLYTQRHGTTTYPMAKLSRNDDFHNVWRQFASEFARGEGYAFKEGYKPEDSPLQDMVASIPTEQDFTKAT
jgi:phenylpropionate dioxygenase-like ring-hydroxylating dioxygenase large terminal subunit